MQFVAVAVGGAIGATLGEGGGRFDLPVGFPRDRAAPADCP